MIRVYNLIIQAGLIFLIIFQMLPLPASILKHLSPNTYALYKMTLSGYDLEDAENRNWEIEKKPPISQVSNYSIYR